MKIINIILHILLVYSVITFIGCKPDELPPDSSNDVVFQVTGNINGTPFTMEAGKNDYYLYTDYQRDDSDIYTFSGHLAKTDICESDCEESLYLEIRDFQSTDGQFDYQQNASFPLGNYDFVPNIDLLNTDITAYNVRMGAYTTSIGAPYTWSVNNNIITTSTDSIFNHTFQDAANQYICVETTDNLTGCYNKYCKTVELNNVTANPSEFLEFIIVPLSQQGGTSIVQLLALTDISYSSIKWDYGDGLYVVLNDTSAIFPVNTNSNDPVMICLEVIDNNGLKTSNCKAVDINHPFNPLNGCSTFYDHLVTDTTISTVPDTSFLSHVIIEYTDKAGTLFSSKNIENNNATFEVISVSDYERNRDNQATTQLKIRFTCEVADDNGNSLVLENITADFAVARPD